MLLKLPVGIQHLTTIRNEGYLYVDKTEQIYRMVSSGKFYFLSRPRRCGKSAKKVMMCRIAPMAARWCWWA